MRSIRKKREPRLLETYRQRDGATFDNLPSDIKEQIQEQLVQEQRGLCCYCQSRIHATWDGMKVEHWQSQSPNKYPERQLDYMNMLGACLGGQKYGEKSPKETHHCDTLKKDSDLCFCLTDTAHPIERQVKFPGSGLITSDDPDINQAINKILNLNIQNLVNNRISRLTGFLQSLEKGVKLDYAKELPKWDGSQEGDLEPFAQVVAYYLLKKLKKAA